MSTEEQEIAPDHVNIRAKLDATRIKFFKKDEFKPWHGASMSYADRIGKVGELPCPTAGTDGKEIVWDPRFVEENSLDYLTNVLAHELTHNMLFHTAGRGKVIQEHYGPETANIAMDHAVNNMLAECGVCIPSDWVCDPKYKGWRVEDIASDIKEDKDDSENEDGDGEGGGQGGEGQSSGKGGGHDLMANASPQQQKQAEQTSNETIANDNLMKAMGDNGDEFASGQGSDHLGSLMEAAREARHKPKSWRQELDEFKGELEGDDFVKTYARPSKHPQPEIIKPGRKRQGKAHIGMVVDTSGSMWSDLPKIMVEMEQMSEDGYSFDVVCTDGEVYGPYSFEAGEFDYRSLPMHGGGGSDMQPAFEHFKEKIPSCDAVIFCTDGYINWPDTEILDQLPPCILVQFDSSKSKEGEDYHKHLLIKSNDDY